MVKGNGKTLKWKERGSERNGRTGKVNEKKKKYWVREQKEKETTKMRKREK